MTKNDVTNNEFDFIGINEKFSGAAGELRAYWTATGQIVEGDTDGNGLADFSIEIYDPLHAITLTKDDFIL